MGNGPFNINAISAAVAENTATIDELYDRFITLEKFGAVGDDSTDNKTAIAAAMAESAASGKVILLDPSKTYYSSGLITHQGNVAMSCIGGTGKIRVNTNQDGFRIVHAPFSFSDMAASSTTTLSSDAVAANNFIVVTSTSGIVVGDFIELRSTAAWPHDDRGVAKKAELLKLADIVGTTLYFTSQVNQTFTTAECTVRVIKPINVHLSNIEVKSSWSTNTERVGFRITGANVFIDNLTVEGFGGAGAILYHCVDGTVDKFTGNKAGGVSSGYGIQLYGCTRTTISGRSWGCRRGADISGNICPSWSNTIYDYDVMGGGIAVDGLLFGVGGQLNYGVGDHGPAAMNYFNNIRLTDVLVPFQHRGRDSYIDGAIVRGVCNDTIINLWHNQQFTAKNVSYKQGFTGSINGAGAVGLNGSYGVPKSFLVVRDAYVGLTETTNQLIIENCDAEVAETFVLGIGSTSLVRTIPDNLELVNNSVNFYCSDSSTVYLVKNSQSSSIGIVGYFEANNRYKRLGTAGTVSKFFNVTATNRSTF